MRNRERAVAAQRASGARASSATIDKPRRRSPARACRRPDRRRRSRHRASGIGYQVSGIRTARGVIRLFVPRPLSYLLPVSCYLEPQAASTSATVFGVAAVKFSCPVAVTITSSSMRTPMFQKCLGHVVGGTNVSARLDGEHHAGTQLLRRALHLVQPGVVHVHAEPVPRAVHVELLVAARSRARRRACPRRARGRCSPARARARRPCDSRGIRRRASPRRDRRAARRARARRRPSAGPLNLPSTGNVRVMSDA